MIKPKIMYDLQVSYGTIYGCEEAAALMDVLKDRAPSCGKKVNSLKRNLPHTAVQNMPLPLPRPPQDSLWQGSRRVSSRETR